MIRTIWNWTKIILARTWQFFASVIVVLMIFMSQFHDFKTPNLALEITSVNATSSQPVDIIKHPELSAVKALTGNDFFPYNSRTIEPNKSYSPDEIERILLVYEDSINKATKHIDNAERSFATAISEPNKNEEKKSLSALHDDIAEGSSAYFLSIALRSKQEVKSGSDEEVSEKLKSNIKDILEIKRKQRDSMLTKHRAANEQWLEFKSKVMPSRTKLVVTCAIGNQGSGATSLKPQALFRADLGEGNYLDFPMKMSDYDSSPEAATLQPQSYKVIKFESDEIQFMTAADRDRFKSFLGNASPARIFASDVRGDIYASNSVPFSPGVYEQKMFDSLKQFASSKIFRQQK